MNRDQVEVSDVPIVFRATFKTYCKVVYLSPVAKFLKRGTTDTRGTVKLINRK